MRALALALTLGTTLAASAAWAADPVDSVRIEVSATVVGRCGFLTTPESPGGSPDVQTARTQHHPFTLDCNTPFVIGVSSAHGALVRQGAGDVNGFATTRSYEVGLEVGTDQGAMSLAACEASDLTAANHPCAFYGATPGQGAASGTAISSGLASDLKVSWDDYSGPARLAAGDYRDTLTIVVGPVT